MQSHSIESASLPFVVSLMSRQFEMPGARGADVNEVVWERFLSHRMLRDAVPNESLSLSWFTIPEGKTLSARTHERRSMLVVLEGKAMLTGRSSRLIERGDVITLPSGFSFGIEGVSGASLQGLELLFEDEAYLDEPRNSTSHAVSFSLEGLLEENERQARHVLENPYFRMIQGGVLDDDRVRGLFRDRLRVFCNAFQTFLFTRQATCDDETFRRTFAEHLLEEIGHNDLMRTTGEPRRFDAILAATSNWFCHQMLVQDNAGKAAIHLVLETGGDYFHNLAKPAFEGDVSSQYFETHAEDDARHKQMSIDLLRDQTSSVYRNLHETVVDAWGMIDAMTRRIHKLVQIESSAS